MYAHSFHTGLLSRRLARGQKTNVGHGTITVTADVAAEKDTDAGTALYTRPVTATTTDDRGENKKQKWDRTISSFRCALIGVSQIETPSSAGMYYQSGLRREDRLLLPWEYKPCRCAGCVSWMPHVRLMGYPGLPMMSRMCCDKKAPVEPLP